MTFCSSHLLATMIDNKTLKMNFIKFPLNKRMPCQNEIERLFERIS